MERGGLDVERFVGLVVALCLFSLFFGVIEWFWPALPDRKRQKGQLKTDLVYWFFTPLISKTITRAVLLVIAIAGALFFGKEVVQERVMSGYGPLSTLPLGAQVALTLIVGDFVAYWGHRLFHTGRLWKVHAIHHSSEHLDWLAATRLHPLNDVIMRVAQASALLALGIPMKILAAYVPFLALHGLFLHANVPWDFGPFRHVISSPKFHRWHHTSQEEGLDKNFSGLFPIWDHLFGTFYMPEERQPERFGVPDAGVPEGIWGQLAFPFRRTRNSIQERDAV